MAEFNTKLVQGIKLGDNETGAVNPPIYNSSTYEYKTLEKTHRWDYERSGNPTREFLEKQIAQLEGGIRGFAYASGMAAIHGVFALFRPGDHIVLSKTIYGGTFRLINQYLKKWGIEFTTVDIQDLTAIEAAIKENTKAIYLETIDNPFLQVASVKQIALISSKHDILTIVDNTFLTPYLQQPLLLGADVVIHSATKYLSGHSDTTAGLVVVKEEALGEKIWFYQNAIGGTLAPENANLVRRGIQTLAVRMDRQMANVELIINALNDSDKVAKIHYPGLAGDASDQIVHDELNGFGGVISITFSDDVDIVSAIGKLKIFRLAVSLGAVESLVEQPYSMSHAELPIPEHLAAGITPQLVRFAVGIEDGEDLVADIIHAFQI